MIEDLGKYDDNIFVEASEAYCVILKELAPYLAGKNKWSLEPNILDCLSEIFLRTEEDIELFSKYERELITKTGAAGAIAEYELISDQRIIEPTHHKVLIQVLNSIRSFFFRSFLNVKINPDLALLEEAADKLIRKNWSKIVSNSRAFRMDENEVYRLVANLTRERIVSYPNTKSAIDVMIESTPEATTKASTPRSEKIRLVSEAITAVGKNSTQAAILEKLKSKNARAIRKGDLTQILDILREKGEYSGPSYKRRSK